MTTNPLNVPDSIVCTNKHYGFSIATTASTVLELLGMNTTLCTSSKILAPSLSSYWLTAFVRHYGNARDLVFTMLSKDGVPRILAPLHKTDSSTLELLCDETSDYNDILGSNPDNEDIRALIEFWLHSGINRMVFSRIPHDSLTIGLLRQVAPELELQFEINACDYMPIVHVSPQLPIDDWPGTSHSRIHKLKNTLSSLQRTSSVSMEIIESMAQLEIMLPEMMSIHVSRWKSVQSNSKFQDEKRIAFTREICFEAFRQGRLFVALLYIEKKLASYQMCFRGGDTIFGWNTAYNPMFRKWSPGHLLVMLLLSDSEKLGFKKFNFMRGQEEYKFFWTKVVQNTVVITLTTH